MIPEELLEQARMELLESKDPYVLVLTIPNTLKIAAVESIRDRFMEWKKDSGITIPCIVLYEGMTLSLVERLNKEEKDEHS